MLKQTSKKLNKLILLQFTKELIKHSGEGEIFELKNILKSEKIKEIEFLQEKEKKIKTKEKEIYKTIKTKLKPKIFQRKIPDRKKILNLLPKQLRPTPIPHILKIPEPRLPPRFQYLRPVITKTQIDLGKLNPLIKDPAVSSIECNGPDKKLIVRIPATKTTNIILNKEEIANIIKKFSETAKIPVSEGILKVAVGGLVLTAVVSEVIETKFTIRKIIPTPIFRRG